MKTIIVEPDSGELWLKALKGDTAANVNQTRLLHGEIGQLAISLHIVSSSSQALTVSAIGVNRPRNQPSYRKMLRSKY